MVQQHSFGQKDPNFWLSIDFGLSLGWEKTKHQKIIRPGELTLQIDGMTPPVA